MKAAASERVRLRQVVPDDIAAFFEHQLDPDANRLAAFTVEDPTDRDAFEVRWGRILSDDTIEKRTILAGDEVVGHIASFVRFGKPEVTYWLDRRHWGRGLATAALARFLEVVKRRPLYARVAKDNAASIRVLEKCGFEIAGDDRGFAHARGEEIEEFVLELRR